MNRPGILYPDACLVLVTRLRELYASITVPSYAEDLTFGTKLPKAKDPITRYVRVRRSGGTNVNVVEDAARLDFQVWYPDDEDPALRMWGAQWVRALVHQAQGSVVSPPDSFGPVTIGQVTEFVGPGQFPDPIRGDREIILWTSEIRLRGKALPA